MTLFSRLRALARSRTAPESLKFPSTTTPHDSFDMTQPWSIPRDETSHTAPATTQLGAKIYPDINALLAEVESGGVEDEMPSSQMWMSSGEQSVEDNRFSSFPMRETRPGASSVEGQRGSLSENEDRTEGPELVLVTRKVDKGKGRAVDGVGDSASGTPSGSQRGWPTFGRERRRVMPDLRIFGRNPTTRRAHRMEEDSAGTARQSTSSTRLDNVYGLETPSSPSRRTTRSSWTYRRKSTTLSRHSSDRRTSLHPNTSTSAIHTDAIPSPALSRAPSHSQRNLEHEPEVLVEMPKAPRGDENTSLSAQQDLLYSPQAPTFGFPSPPSHPLSIIPSPDASEFLTPASPPPLHSTPNNAKTSEANVGIFDFNPPSSGPDRNFRFRGSNRLRQLTFGGASTMNSLGLPPLSSTFGKNPRSRAQSDKPKASKIFSDTHNVGGGMHQETGLAETSSMRPFGNSTNLNPRSGSDPPKHRSNRRSAKRRRSAEWRSHTAAVGVTASPKDAGNYGWPADVSREILKLSLGGPTTTATTTSTREEQQVKSSSISSASRGQSAFLQPRSNKEAIYARPNKEEVSHYNTFPASRRQSQMRTEVPPHALSFSFPILPSPSSSPLTARPAFNAGPASAAAEPTVSQPGPRHTSHSLGVGSKISETRGLGTGRTDEAGDGLGTLREVKERDSGMIQHVRSTSESDIRWSSKKMQDLLDRADLESGEGGLRHDTSIALPPKDTLRLVPSTSSRDQLSSTQAASQPGSPDRPLQDAVDASFATSTPLQKSDKSKGKRKADEAEDGSPPKSEGRKSSFAAQSMRDPRVSNASHAPSSYLSQKSRKRVRLSSPLPSPGHSRRGSLSQSNAQVVGTWSSRNSSRTNASSSMQQASTSSPPQRTASRASHARSASLTTPAGRQQTRRSISDMSQSSIPISAIISPHPPSIDRLSNFHVRDPRKPPPKRPVGWTLRFRTADDYGSPLQAWLFWAGFLLPLLWWFASFWSIRKTRMLDAEKSIPVDDPNEEHESRTWRTRCRVVSVLFFFTYVPVIVLLAIFA